MGGRDVLHCNNLVQLLDSAAANGRSRRMATGLIFLEFPPSVSGLSRAQGSSTGVEIIDSSSNYR